ncbi:high mobility group protein Z [Hafnia paralvei]|uniref:High mobility group protein Z n=1 Tax=Hafnia paralvei TaxID=546367 RepID=A0A2A2MDS2_9GAMM|nr:high mobility group protein Z [Hafnia paralvei]PAV96526.1 high mobility group protein Z [Hafnia paralvei]PNK66556.1 high mobility group protein Z [Hafnia paralvei]RDA66777.1 high mobility group protein Z [Hafnia paralvei]RDA67486.1 high mobility group protein Z [Hafnia paralvei]
MWLILIIALLLTCYLLWLLGKLWWLSRRKQRWRQAAMTRQFSRLPRHRSGRRNHRKE